MRLSAPNTSGIVRLPSAYPAHWLLGIVASFFGTLYLTPLEPTSEPRLQAAVFWFIVTLAFLTGLAYGQTREVTRKPPVSALSLHRTTRFAVTLGSVGVLLLIFDRFYIRGAPLQIDFFAVRDALEESSPGLVGTASAFLGGFAPFGWILHRVTRFVEMRDGRAIGSSSALAWIGLINTTGYVLLSAMAGSRAVMLVVVVIHVVALLHLAQGVDRRSMVKAIFFGIALIILATLVSSVIMLERLEQMGIDPIFSIQYSGYAEALQPSAAVLNWIGENPASSSAMAVLLSLALYVYHGYFEFVQLFQNFSADHTFGAQLMWLPLKFLAVLTGLDFTVAPGHLPGVREGIFTTGVGPFFIDFGWFAPIPAFAMGVVMGYPAAQLRARQEGWLPAACISFAVVAVFPIVSLLDSAAGAYLLVAAACLALLSGHPIYTGGAPNAATPA